MPMTFESECAVCGSRIIIVERFTGALVSQCSNEFCSMNERLRDELRDDWQGRQS